jgi:hypothetical protein
MGAFAASSTGTTTTLGECDRGCFLAWGELPGCTGTPMDPTLVS